MLKIVTAALTLVALPIAAAAQPAPARIDLADYDHYLAKPATEVVVLGTAHLSGWKDFVDRPGLDTALAPMLDRLATYAPDTIVIENISGSDCDHLFRYKEVFAGAESYCRDLSYANDFTGLSAPEAEKAIMDTMLAGGPGSDPVARRTLAAQFLASGDRASALVQWLRLADKDRVAGSELSDEMVKALDAYSTGLNESVSIGVALAVRLGHERIWPVDDHSADQLYLRTYDKFGERMQEIWSSGDLSARAKYEAATNRLKSDRDVLAFYRTMNSVESQDATIRGDFAKGLADDQPEGVGQDYVNWWQVRNLRMVANIVAAASLNHSQRTLAIVGASHKAYYEGYLAPMHHIRVKDVSEIIGE